MTAKATPENLRIIETLASLHPAEQYLFFGEVPALEACPTHLRTASACQHLATDVRWILRSNLSGKRT